MSKQLKERFPSNAIGHQTANEIRRSAFVILYTKELSLWEHHTEKPTAVRQDKSPAFLMVRRSDYMMGFPGGGLKPNESERQGAVQELKEELGITFIHQDRLEVLSHQKFHNSRGIKCETLCFTAELSPEEFKDVLRNAHRAEHFMAETRGLIPVSMEHTAKDKPFPFENFLRSPMPPSVRQDLTEFLVSTKLLDTNILHDLINKKLLPAPTDKASPTLPEHEFSQ
jgi:8-oxo-dGTP pyrophosphatase MutT (NUDIX family)